MTKSDIVVEDITKDMRKEARREVETLKIKWGRNTRATVNKHGELVERDYVGSLAHQAVENVFHRYSMPIVSTRKELYVSGDSLDIKFEEDKIDVKGTKREFNEKYFFNETFLVFKQQLDNPKINFLTHFVFVTIDPDYRTARIYGAISVKDFIEKSTEVNLMYKNRGIKAYQLTPFRNYVFRV